MIHTTDRLIYVYALYKGMHVLLYCQHKFFFFNINIFLIGRLFDSL